MQSPASAEDAGNRAQAGAVVLDTNILLDLCVFEDPQCASLREQLKQRALKWLATAAMREELLRVLAYPQIARRLVQRGIEASVVLAWFDDHAQLREPAPKAPFTCKDPDDQKFIDLAVVHSALLLSKDDAVLCMARRLQRLGVTVARSLP